MHWYVYALAAVPAVVHLFLAIVEMKLWTTKGKKALGAYFEHPEFFEVTKPLAYHMGLYNVFLAAGLIWSLSVPGNVWYQHPAIFFLACMVVAGLEGWRTIALKLFVYQSVPAIVVAAVLIPAVSAR